MPNGAGWYVKQNGDGGEVLNFKAIDGKYYGYARIRNGDALNISRLGAAKQDDYIDDVTVVLFAKDPSVGGQFVVGWYRNARLYRRVQEKFAKRAPHPYYMVEAKVKDSVLLPLPLRKFETPGDGPGQTNAWYVLEYRGRKAYLSELEQFMKDPKGYGKPSGEGSAGGGWMKDVEKRKEIEMAAMEATEEFFENKGFRVKYVHNEKVGWDMEASKGAQVFRLEVKGSHLPLASVLLTPNEFHHSGQHKNYRICILENALDKNRSKLHICQLAPDRKFWIGDTGCRLKVCKVVSARLDLES